MSMCIMDVFKGEEWPRLTMSSGYTDGPSLDTDVVSGHIIDSLGACHGVSLMSHVKFTIGVDKCFDYIRIVHNSFGHMDVI